MRHYFTPRHWTIFLTLWVLATLATHGIVRQGLDQGPQHEFRVWLTTAATILGPMTGAISRGCQSCCLEFSFQLLPWCGGILLGGTIPQLVPLPFRRFATLVRLTAWTAGWVGWYFGGIVSFGHALS